MPTDPKELIVSIPAAAEAVAARDDATAAEILNSPTETVSRLLQTWEVKLLVIEAGVYPKIAAAAQSHAVELVQGAAFTAYSYVTDPSFQTLDLTRDSTQLMLGALVQGGVMEQAVVDALAALATRQVGAWEKEYGKLATVDEIATLYAVERAAEQDATILAERVSAYESAVATLAGLTPEDDSYATALQNKTRRERELRETQGGEEVLNGQ
jgi:hypothetical protein